VSTKAGTLPLRNSKATRNNVFGGEAEIFLNVFSVPARGPDGNRAPARFPDYWPAANNFV